jgi:hypothetical protein
LEYVRDSGALYFDVEIDLARLGYPMTATLGLTVTPSALSSTATHWRSAPGRLRGGHHRPVEPGSERSCRDDAALYAYLADDLGGLTGIQQVETAPMIRTLKASAPWIRDFQLIAAEV